MRLLRKIGKWLWKLLTNVRTYQRAKRAAKLIDPRLIAIAEGVVAAYDTVRDLTNEQKRKAAVSRVKMVAEREALNAAGHIVNAAVELALALVRDEKEKKE